MKKIKAIKKVFIGSSLLLLLTVVVLYFWFSNDNYYVNTVNEQSASSVGYSFSLALMENKEAKPLVAQELWSEVDKWMIRHEVFKCPSSWPLNDKQSFGGGSFIAPDKMQKWYSHDTYCSGVEGVYSFEVRGIMLQKIGNKWQVIGWDEICETYPGEKECHAIFED